MQTPNNIFIEGKNYEIITFGAKITNRAITVRGIALAQGYLAISGVAPNYRIYNTKSGEPIIKARFADFKIALELAKYIERNYKDYFDMWSTYPEADLLMWCRYTVPNGERFYDLKLYLDKLEMITQRDYERIWKGEYR